MQQNLNQPLNPQYGQPGYGMNAGPQYGQPAYGQPAYGQPAYGQNTPFDAPHANQAQPIAGNEPPAHVGVGSALTLDIVLAVLGILGGLSGASQNPQAAGSLAFYIMWLVLIIVAFNSGYKQNPIKNPGYLGCYKIFRIIYYWFFTIGSAIGAGLFLIFGIMILSIKTDNNDEGTGLRNFFGVFFLIMVPICLLFTWLGSYGIKLNRHFDRLLDGNIPQRPAQYA